MRLSQPICKISQNVPNITWRPHRDTHFLFHAFFLRLIVSEKISDTFDIKFKYLKIIQTVFTKVSIRLFVVVIVGRILDNSQ